MSDALSNRRLPPAYWRLWWAAAVDNVGDGAFTAAVPLLAVTLTNDPRTISVVAACTYLPWLLLSLPVGALVDRHDRVRLMWCAQAAQAVVVGVVAVLVGSGEMAIPVLAASAFLLGIGEVVFGNAAQAVLPDLVAAPLLQRANGNQYTVTTVGQQFVGPPVGSVLFTAAAGLPFAANAVSFALSAGLLATLPRRRRGQHPASPAGTSSAIRDGLRWLVRHRLIRTLAVLLGVNTFCFQLGNVTLVLLATQTLQISQSGYGLLLTGAAVGSILGGTVTARVAARFGSLPTLVAALGANTAVFVGIGVSPNEVLLAVLLAANGFLTSAWNIITVSLRQEVVPRDLIGRVNSVYRMLGWGLMPLGALAGGLVAHQFGARSGYPIAGTIRGIALITALPALGLSLRLARPGSRAHQTTDD